MLLSAWNFIPHVFHSNPLKVFEVILHTLRLDAHLDWLCKKNHYQNHSWCSPLMYVCGKWQVAAACSIMLSYTHCSNLSLFERRIEVNRVTVLRRSRQPWAKHWKSHSLAWAKAFGNVPRSNRNILHDSMWMCWCMFIWFDA